MSCICITTASNVADPEFNSTNDDTNDRRDKNVWKKYLFAQSGLQDCIIDAFNI